MWVKTTGDVLKTGVLHQLSCTPDAGKQTEAHSSSLLQSAQPQTRTNWNIYSFSMITERRRRSACASSNDLRTRLNDLIRDSVKGHDGVLVFRPTTTFIWTSLFFVVSFHMTCRALLFLSLTRTNMKRPILVTWPVLLVRCATPEWFSRSPRSHRKCNLPLDIFISLYFYSN